MQPQYLALILPPDYSRRMGAWHQFVSWLGWCHHPTSADRTPWFNQLLFRVQFPANAFGTHLPSHGILQRSTRSRCSKPNRVGSHMRVPADGLHDLHINYNRALACRLYFEAIGAGTSWPGADASCTLPQTRSDNFDHLQSPTCVSKHGPLL